MGLDITGTRERERQIEIFRYHRPMFVRGGVMLEGARSRGVYVVYVGASVHRGFPLNRL